MALASTRPRVVVWLLDCSPATLAELAHNAEAIDAVAPWVASFERSIAQSLDF